MQTFEKLSLDALCDRLRENKKTLIIYHVRSDADAVGSAFALRELLKLMGITVDTYLKLLHYFKKCGLCFRGSSVYFVRKKEVTDRRSVSVFSFTCLLVNHCKACNIRGHKVWCKLDTVTYSVYTL